MGEPALGPVPFMHRASAAENPTAPIAHHIFDSTHIASSDPRARRLRQGLVPGIGIPGPRVGRGSLRPRFRRDRLMVDTRVVETDTIMGDPGIARVPRRA